MQSVPTLTDRQALTRNRRRARRFGEDAFFLHRLAADEVKERLNAVNREFTAPAVVTGAPQVWKGKFPGALIVEDEESLRLEPGAHDVVVHALALHWANDPVGQLVQARRALKPDGLFIGITLGGITLHELRSALAEAEAAATGGLSPRVAPMGEIRDLGALLQRAGFALPVADNILQTVTYRSAYDLMRDLRKMGENNALASRLRRPTTRAVFDRAARIYADAFQVGDGQIRASFDLIFLTGWAPSDTQPKPLRPGSATTRLADALGTYETSAGDTVGPSKD